MAMAGPQGSSKPLYLEARIMYKGFNSFLEIWKLDKFKRRKRPPMVFRTVEIKPACLGLVAPKSWSTMSAPAHSSMISVFAGTIRHSSAVGFGDKEKKASRTMADFGMLRH